MKRKRKRKRKRKEENKKNLFMFLNIRDLKRKTSFLLIYPFFLQGKGAIYYQNKIGTTCDIPKYKLLRRPTKPTKTTP